MLAPNRSPTAEPPSLKSHAPTRKIGLITNPHSRRNRAGLGSLAAIVANRPHILHRVTESPAQTLEVLRELAAAGVEVVGINGGDGTTAQVFTELLVSRPFAVLPQVVLLPGGTTNVNAHDVGLRGGLQRAATRLVRWADGSGRAQRLRRPIVKIEGAALGSPLCGMVFGAGSFIRGIEYCQSTFHRHGIGDAIGPALTMLRVIWGTARNEPRFATPTPMRIELETLGATPPRSVLLMIVTSLDGLILGMRPYWGREAAPLHCTWIEKPAQALLRLLPSLLRGNPAARATPERGYHSHNSARLRLWFDGPFTLDGEVHSVGAGGGPLIISSGGELEFLRIEGDA